MAIAAFFEPTEAGHRPRAHRRTLHFEAGGRKQSGEVARVLVHNASTGGLLLETDERLEIGEQLEIDLPQAGPTMAVVVWSSDRLHGCRFAEPISDAALSAAELRSVVGVHPLATPRNEAAPSTFGHHLQQLRKARGMTLADLAQALSVSKPTVWAWEHGKARPIDSRLPALAEALGVSGEDLQPSATEMVPADLIERCRVQIAETAGISPQSVRILIEL